MGMILGCMAAGILLGMWAIGQPGWEQFFRIFGRVQHVSTVILLFAMGLWLGGNDQFWSNIQVLGLRGAVFGLATGLGSALCVKLLAWPALERRRES